jgi:hypothetical protein
MNMVCSKAERKALGGVADFRTYQRARIGAAFYPPGCKPGSTAGRMPAATIHGRPVFTVCFRELVLTAGQPLHYGATGAKTHQKWNLSD